MDNLLINLIGIGKQTGTTGDAPLKESTELKAQRKDFLSTLTNILSGNNNQESILKKLEEINESGEPGLVSVMSSISNMLLSIIPQNAGDIATQAADQQTTGDAGTQKATQEGKETNTTKDISGWLDQVNYKAFKDILANEKPDSVSPDQRPGETAKEDLADGGQVKVFQEEMMRILSSLNGGIEQMTVQKGTAFDLQQALFKERHNAGSQIGQEVKHAPITGEILTKDLMEKNAIFLRAILENGGKVNREDSIKTSNQGDNQGLDSLLGPGKAQASNIVNQSLASERGYDEGRGEKHESDAQGLILNAAKKYKEHVSETSDLKTRSSDEISSVTSHKTSNDVPQVDSFRSNVFQVKDNNITFEKGSFTSFVTGRIEKIIEQFSGKSSQMDMVVRLKLDDTETLLVGLRHDGQKVIVDVKASNDGLANLVQAHKEDIARHLEDKNIFTSIFVQPDGERNSERQSQRQNRQGEKKQEMSSSFINILEETA